MNQISSRNEILAISFGTSYPDSRKKTIGAIEDCLAGEFPAYSVRRAFTSPTIIEKIRRQEGIEIDHLIDGLRRAAKEGVETLVIQPTHMMGGFEYERLVSQAETYGPHVGRMAVGKPLLTDEEDFRRVAQALAEDTSAYDDGRTAFCFVGHGTQAQANQVYARLQNLFSDGGYSQYYVGTVEACPSLKDVAEAVRKGEYRRVVIQPLMIVAGDHANNDMAGDHEDSWKSVFERAGYEVICRMRGLGELEAVRRLFADHVREALDGITEPGTPPLSPE